MAEPDVLSDEPEPVTPSRQRLVDVVSDEETEVAWRADVMRPQVPPRGGIPFLVARRLPVQPGCCHSCGDPKPPGHFVRCGLCIRAATLVLDEVREGVGPPERPTP